MRPAATRPPLKRRPVGGRPPFRIVGPLIDPVGATVLAVAGVSEASIALALLTTGRRSTSWPRVRGFVHRAWTPLLGQVLTGWAPPALKYEYVVNGVVHYEIGRASCRERV